MDAYRIKFFDVCTCAMGKYQMSHLAWTIPAGELIVRLVFVRKLKCFIILYILKSKLDGTIINATDIEDILTNEHVYFASTTMVFFLLFISSYF